MPAAACACAHPQARTGSQQQGVCAALPDPPPSLCQSAGAHRMRTFWPASLPSSPMKWKCASAASGAASSAAEPTYSAEPRLRRNSITCSACGQGGRGGGEEGGVSTWQAHRQLGGEATRAATRHSSRQGMARRLRLMARAWRGLGDRSRPCRSTAHGKSRRGA